MEAPFVGIAPTAKLALLEYELEGVFLVHNGHAEGMQRF
jgi:hypothetical protein